MAKRLLMMGDPEVFAGHAKLKTNEIFYSESAEFFASMIREYFTEGTTLKLADLGSAGGELCKDILSRLPGYAIDVTAFDVDEQALKRDTIAKQILADLTEIPIEDKLFNLAIMRYVLQWNTLPEQEKILNEAIRVTKGIVIIQHCGPDDENKERWRANADHMINDSGIDRMKRGKNYFYSSPQEVEQILSSAGVNFKRVQHRRVEDYVDIFIERYNLNPEESDRVRKNIGDTNYIMQTSWVLDLRK